MRAAVAVLGSTVALMAGPTWTLRWSQFTSRLDGWWSAASNAQGISSEQVPFTLGLVGVTWLLGFVAAWALVRWRNIWVGLVIGGFAFTLNLSHLSNGSHLGWVFLYLLATFALVLWHQTLPDRYHVGTPSQGRTAAALGLRGEFRGASGDFSGAAGDFKLAMSIAGKSPCSKMARSSVTPASRWPNFVATPGSV